MFLTVQISAWVGNVISLSFCFVFVFLSADKNYKHFFSLLEQPNKEL